MDSGKTGILLGVTVLKGNGTKIFFERLRFLIGLDIQALLYTSTLSFHSALREPEIGGAAKRWMDGTAG